MNYFELFSIPANYSVNQAQLSETYRSLQKECHPDNFVMHSDVEKLRAMQQSTEINYAYQTLKNNCLRAQYLLLLAGLDIDLEKKTLQDIDFLMQQMQWRETLESFTENEEDQLEAFNELISEKVTELEALIEDQLKKNQLEETANSIRKLKFMLKLHVEIESIEDKFWG